MDTSNRFGVGVLGGKVVIGMPMPRSLTVEEAENLAANVIVMSSVVAGRSSEEQTKAVGELAKAIEEA